jgi:leucyl aminopeptidase
MIELSTLTSAIRTAVGAERAGLFTNTERFVNKMKTLSEFTEEGFWHMPIFEEHRS